MLREKKLDLQKGIQMCTSSEVASHQMKKIQGVESKQTEEVKKLGEKKKTARKPHPKKEAEKQAKSDLVINRRNLLQATSADTVAVNNVMKEERSVRVSVKRAAIVKRRVISPMCVMPPRKYTS